MTAEDGKKIYREGRGRECDYCKISPAVLFCRPDSAFLCSKCDSKVHRANKLASRHERVQMCDVCEDAPAAFTCKADSASLCAICDSDVHSANPLARRHERVPVVPFFRSPQIMNHVVDDDEENNDYDAGDGRDVKEDEERKSDGGIDSYYQTKPASNSVYFFSDVDSYLDLDYAASMDQNSHPHQLQHHHMTADSVVPGIAVGIAAPFQPPLSFFSKVPNCSYSPYTAAAASFTPSQVSSSTEALGSQSGEKEKISMTFVNKHGEEKIIKVPIGMSLLEAAHENDIELEGACEGSLACSTCHVIVMDIEHYNKLEDPTDEENDMLDLAFGLTETSRLRCQVIASPELDGLCLALPSATRNFAVDGHVPKPH